MTTNKQALAAQIFAQMTAQLALDGSLEAVREGLVEDAELTPLEALSYVTQPGGPRDTFKARLRGEFEACQVYAELAAAKFYDGGGSSS